MWWNRVCPGQHRPKEYFIERLISTQVFRQAICWSVWVPAGESRRSIPAIQNSKQKWPRYGVWGPLGHRWNKRVQLISVAQGDFLSTCHIIAGPYTSTFNWRLSDKPNRHSIILEQGTCASQSTSDVCSETHESVWDIVYCPRDAIQTLWRLNNARRRQVIFEAKTGSRIACLAFCVSCQMCSYKSHWQNDWALLDERRQGIRIWSHWNFVESKGNT
jgi:hypothetical protein